MKTRLRPAAAVTGALPAAVPTDCSSGSGTGNEPNDNLAVSHVPALGVHPAGGRLSVAAHQGVIAVSENGTAERLSPGQRAGGRPRHEARQRYMAR